MISRRTLLLGFLALASAAGCSKTDPPPTPTAASGPLLPSETVDPAFTGCARSCGSRSAKDRAEARAQPGASPGDAVYCPVSGAIFRITDATVHRESRGKTLYFCCDMCAAFFMQHEAEVLEKRGLG
jgi:YHS domain-containing protein